MLLSLENLFFALVAIAAVLGVMVAWEAHQLFLVVFCALLYTGSIFRIGFLTGYPNRR